LGFFRCEFTLNINSGGSVLQVLVDDFGKDIAISALVRSIASRDGVQKLGATPIHFDGLHDIETIKKVASEHDGK
jgi:hypothetical protein